VYSDHTGHGMNYFKGYALGTEKLVHQSSLSYTEPHISPWSPAAVGDVIIS
jgi:hypothetical protein